MDNKTQAKSLQIERFQKLNQLYSIHYHTENVIKVKTDIITRALERPTKIVIISAYYSDKFLLKFLSEIAPKNRKVCEILMIFNGFAGFRLEEQINDLKSLEKQLEGLGFQRIIIYLNTFSSLFHTKLYSIENINEKIWFIGSANASESAFTQNEEILYQLNGNNKQFENYVNKVFNCSEPYDSISVSPIDSLVKFWRTGLIYYKPNVNLTFTFNRLKIPEWVKKRVSYSPPSFSNPGEPWGPFNLKLALNIDESEERRKIVKIAKWSIETCFGLWVPSKYKKEFDTKIESVSESKRTQLEEIKSELTQNKKFTTHFRKYLEDINKNLESIYKGYSWKLGEKIVILYSDDYYYFATVKQVKSKFIYIQYDDGEEDRIIKGSRNIAGVGKKIRKIKGIPRKAFKPDERLIKEFWYPPNNLINDFEKFIEKIKKNLNNDTYLSRASSPLVSSTMPEIWSDQASMIAFSDSFFEYVSHKLNTVQRKPAIIKSIVNKCIKNGDYIDVDIKKLLEGYIKINGWPDDNWLES